MELGNRKGANVSRRQISLGIVRGLFAERKGRRLKENLRGHTGCIRLPQSLATLGTSHVRVAIFDYVSAEIRERLV